MFYIIAIFGLGLLVTVHEIGHMFAARLFGIRVDKFSIFFGPTLARWKRKDTIYRIASIPLGGYVQIAGMNPEEKLSPDDTGSYQNKSLLARFVTIFAGPAVNYVFAILIMIMVTLSWGDPGWEVAVGEVLRGKAAAIAGMKAGDVFEKIDGEPVQQIGQVLSAIQKSNGKSLAVVVRRNDQSLPLTITPKAENGSYFIGIQFGRKLQFSKLSFVDALKTSVVYPFVESQNVLDGLKKLFTEKETLKKVGGPVEIIRQLKMSFEDSFAMAMMFMALLNIYLGLFNLLPIPALDGGRLLFILFSAITRLRVNQKMETVIHTVGFYLLLGLLLIVTYGDIRRRFGL